MIRYAILSALVSVGCSTGGLSLTNETLIRVDLGDTVLVKVQFTDDQATSVRRIPGSEFDDSTFTFRLTDESEGEKTLVMLAARNQLDRTIKYDLHLIVPNLGEPLYTSSCPLRPGIWVFEGWPHPIMSLEISNLRFTRGEDEAGCE